ncbi:hypothetical protein Tcan_04146 [Toxocara canis]|uniref:Uncharacterized protein n=1 Tax=Toxocara canis TaxID=6265 RepID=A0A0B2VUD6_TOXCA|nr:hypothetical protein Tcan_04146 [Toxocara canis]
MKVDEYLRKNLSAERLAKIAKIKAEADIDEQPMLHTRSVRHISESDKQIVQKYLNEGDVRMKVDEYLRKNLSAERLAKIAKIKAEADIDEQPMLHTRSVRHISESDKQIVQKYLNEGQQDQMSGLLYMGRSMGVPEGEIGDLLDHYLQSVLDDQALNELGQEITLRRHKRI